jgi:hypothetical protein
VDGWRPCAPWNAVPCRPPVLLPTTPLWPSLLPRCPQAPPPALRARRPWRPSLRCAPGRAPATRTRQVRAPCSKQGALPAALPAAAAAAPGPALLPRGGCLSAFVNHRAPPHAHCCPCMHLKGLLSGCCCALTIAADRQAGSAPVAAAAGLPCLTPLLPPFVLSMRCRRRGLPVAPRGEGEGGAGAVRGGTG